MLIQFNFIRLPIRCILNLAAILRRKVSQVSLRRRSNFESSGDRHQFYRFKANKRQSNYKVFKVASYSACYLANSDYILTLLEKPTSENKVTAAVKWYCCQFNCNSGRCIVILQHFSMRAFRILFVIKNSECIHGCNMENFPAGSTRAYYSTIKTMMSELNNLFTHKTEKTRHIVPSYNIRYHFRWGPYGHVQCLLSSVLWPTGFAYGLNLRTFVYKTELL